MHPLAHTVPASTDSLGYVRLGTGPTHVLVLHDWLGDHANYQPLAPYLDTQAFTYVFADLRGYGHSRALRGRYTVEEIAADSLSLADALGWQRFHLIGHSMTSMAVQRIAADAPRRIASAIAVCPISAAGNRLDAEARAFFARTRDDDEALRRLFAFVSPGLAPGWAEHKLRQNRRSIDPGCVHAYLAMMTDSDFVAAVRGLDTPFLVLIGEHDPGLDEAAMQASFLAWHPGARLLRVPHCGHYPMQECPPYFAGAIERFLHEHA